MDFAKSALSAGKEMAEEETLGNCINGPKNHLSLKDVDE